MPVAFALWYTDLDRFGMGEWIIVNLQQIAETLGIAEIPASWERNADHAAACFPEEVHFLQDEYVSRIRNRVRLSDRRAGRICEAMATIRRHESLRSLAWLWHFIIFRQPDPEIERVGSWPAPLDPSGEDETFDSIFPAVVLLSGYEQLAAVYEKRRIPEKIIVETLDAVEGSMELYEGRTGIHGLGMGYFNWLQHAFHARLYRIGRLEYEIKAFPHAIRVYRHMRDGQIYVLSADGVRYRGDGLVDGTNGVIDDQTGWTAEWVETESEIRGYPIHPGGYALQEPVCLKKSEWRLALSEGDPVINVHIPRKGSFTPDDCRDSFIQAAKFFATHYADRPYAALMCVSWLLDPQLRQLMGTTSNLVQFQQWYHLYPVQSDDGGLYSFVFMCERGEIESLPERTSLQRKMKQFMREGGRLHNAGGILFPDDERLCHE